MEVYSFGQYRLRQLHHWLTIGGNSMWLWVAAYFLGPVIGGLLILAALVFTPYMLWALYQAGRKGWIVGFLVFVAAPAVVGGWLVPMSGVGIWVIGSYVLLAFYSYTWALRHQVQVWIERETWETRLRSDE